MQVAIVSASAVFREGRLDADFHIALDQLGEAIDDLRREYDEAEAVRIVDSIPLPDKQALNVLRTGSSRRSMTSQEAHDVTVRYPHFALALVMRDANEAIMRIRDQIARNQETLRQLVELADVRIRRLTGLNSNND